MDASFQSTNSSPPSEKWEANRQKIVRLYWAENKSLDDVMLIMSREERFEASKRMYQNWLKKWRVRKNWTKERKEGLLGLADTDRRGLNSSERRRLRRYKADKRKRDESKAGGLTHTSPQSDEASESISSRQSSPRLLVNGGFSVNVGKSAGPSNLSISPASAASLTPQWSSECAFAENLEAFQQPPFWTETKISNTLSTGPWFLSTSIGESWAHGPSMPLEWPLTADPTRCNLPSVLHSTKELIMSHAQAIRQGQDESQRAAFTPPSVMEHFWAELNNCIYLFKLRDWRRAEPLYKRLRNKSWEIFTNITPDFLRRFLTAFCPVNFEINPVVRKGLLDHFQRSARYIWCDTHPFCRLLSQLQLDIRSREVSEKALSCLRGSVNEQSAHMESQNPSVEFEASMAMIAIQRRSKDFDTAAQSALTLYSHSRQNFGPGSFEVRDAAEQLAHVYMDTQDLNEAKVLCRERVGPAVGSDALIGVGYHDKRAMRAMEDLAEIERKLGQPQNCIPWLKAAAGCAVDLKRPDIYIVHLVDKVIESLRMCDMHEEALLWKKYFTYDVWKKKDVDFWTKLDAGSIQCCGSRQH